MKLTILITALILASITASAQQCTAITNKGTQCSRKAKEAQIYCTQHNPKTVKCKGITKTGKHCHLQPTKGATTCRMHQ
jgi:hypothetical protein